MKKTLIVFTLIFICYSLIGQGRRTKKLDNKISVTVGIGYDVAKIAEDFEHYEAGQGLNASIQTNIDINSYFGIDIGYSFFKNMSATSLSSSFVDERSMMQTLSKNENELVRHFIGMGPCFKFPIVNLLSLKLQGLIGYGSIKGGEIVAFNVQENDEKKYHFLFSGFDGSSIGYNASFHIDFAINSKISLNLITHYQGYRSLSPDGEFDFENIGKPGFIYGSSVFDASSNPPVVLKTDALLIEETSCSLCYSYGVSLGVRYTFD